MEAGRENEDARGEEARGNEEESWLDGGRLGGDERALDADELGDDLRPV